MRVSRRKGVQISGGPVPLFRRACSFCETLPVLANLSRFSRHFLFCGLAPICNFVRSNTEREFNLKNRWMTSVRLHYACVLHYRANNFCEVSMKTTVSGVHVVDHPLVQHKLTLMRDAKRSTQGFRRLLNEIGMLLCYEVTRDLPIEMVETETPITKMMAPTIAGKKLVFAPILRAGVGFLDGMLNLVPSARVAHIGLYRDPETLEAVEYYFKAPSDLADRMVVLMDPMLATGNSAIAAMERLKARGAKDIRFMCLLAAPEGIKALQDAHPEVKIWTASVDSHLNDHGYIVPGLGDAGDRMFGTK